MIKITEHLYYIDNGMNIVVVKAEKSVCMINCNGAVKADLSGSGIVNPELTICLDFRASINSGIIRFPETKIAAPAKFRHLYENPTVYLTDGKNRLKLFASLSPDNDVIREPVQVDIPLSAGQTLDFHGIKLNFFEFAGYAEGELCCYIDDGIRIGICGDQICNDGKIPFLYRISKGLGAGGAVGDYHAFLLRVDEYLAGLDALSRRDILIPARGGPIGNPRAAVDALQDRLRRLRKNYMSVTALNHYFPGLFKPEYAMPPAAAAKLPEFIKYTGTSFLIISKSGRGFLIDCGAAETVKTLCDMRKRGLISTVDACFITHYHNDHVDALDELISRFNTKIFATESESDVIANPEKYYLPCLSGLGFKNDILADGQSFRWEEFEITAVELPGQTLHHGGLIVDDGNGRVIFCGDSFSPTGIDDYCMQNRCFYGGGRDRGFRKCLELVIREKPAILINSHQPSPFVYADNQIDYLRRTLDERDKLLDELSPWRAADFSLDPYWIRIYPYVSYFDGSDSCEMELQITSHCAGLNVSFELTASGGRVTPDKFEITLPAPTCGYKRQAADGDICLPFTFQPLEDRDAYVIAVQARLDGVYFGETCKGIIIKT